MSAASIDRGVSGATSTDVAPSVQQNGHDTMLTSALHHDDAATVVASRAAGNSRANSNGDLPSDSAVVIQATRTASLSGDSTDIIQDVCSGETQNTSTCSILAASTETGVTVAVSRENGNADARAGVENCSGTGAVSSPCVSDIAATVLTSSKTSIAAQPPPTADEPTSKRARISASATTSSQTDSAGTVAVSGPRTVELIEASLLKLKREVKALDLLIKQKEREWDGLLKLRKLKEETFQRLRRKRQVLLIQQCDGVVVAQQQQQQSAVSGGGGSAATAGVELLSSMVRAAPSGVGPHGPTVSVRHLIDSHRAATTVAATNHVQPPPYSESVALAAASRQQQQQQTSSAALASESRYRELMAQIRKLNKQLPAAVPEVSIQQVPMTCSAGGAAAAAAAVVAASQQQSSLAKLLMESKRKSQSDVMLSEILKQPAVSLATAGAKSGVAVSPLSQQTPPSAAGRLQAVAGVVASSQTEDTVPVCQGCRVRPAQFVCAGCGNQWYCSRECQVAAWDSHADECNG